MSGEDGSLIASQRLAQLRKTFARVTKKREERVIGRLVREYRDGELTADKAYSAVIVIAELRNAESDIRQEDVC